MPHSTRWCYPSLRSLQGIRGMHRVLALATVTVASSTVALISLVRLSSNCASQKCGLVLPAGV